MTTFFCDSNVWVALTLFGHPKHVPVKAWYDGLTEADQLLFCRSTQQSFLRLITTEAIVRPMATPPSSNRVAWQLFDEITVDRRVQLRLHEPEDLELWWRRYSERNTASPKLWMDAYLAAYARAEGCTLVTMDGAFTQFEGLDVLVLG